MLERFPDLNGLSRAEKLQLAEELEQQALSGLTVKQEDELEAIVRERWQAYVAEPAAVSTLDQIRDRKLGPQHA